MAVQESRLLISIDARNAERTAKALNSELQGITNNGNKATSQTNALGTSMQALAGYMAGVVTVGAAINKIDAYTNLQNRLKLVTNSQQELNKAMNDTFGIAQRSYQTWDSVVQVYQRFSDNAKTLGINMEQTAKLTETVSKAVAVSGASTQAAEAALTQFGQALASGTLRGEELNSILEQTPALAKAIAQGMGITVGQLRAVAAEGKITGDVLVDALTKSADSVEELFSKTNITISQSIGLLSNELTKFIGEAGQSSGAANLLAGSIKLLSENLSLLADAAIIGGIGYITKAILTKTVAVQADIAASIAQKAATTAEAQSSIALATAKANEAKAHLANVQATNAETQAKYGAAAANARYKLASDAVTQSIIAQNAAQGALNTSVGLGSRALALVGGPIGAITIGVSALAAGYMYLQSRTAEANAKLEEQGQIASKTSEELKKLAGNDKVSAVNDLTAAFNSQNEALSKSKEAVDAVLFAIRASSVENERARKITEDARNGVISYTDAIKLLNNEKISVDLYNKLKQQADQYDENSSKAANTQRALADLKVEVNLAGNAMQDAANKALNKAAAMDQDASSTRNAASANRDYINSLQAGDIAKAARTIISKGYSPEVAKELATLAVKNGKVTREEANAILYKNKQQVALNETIQQYQKINSPKAAASASKKAQSEAAKEAKQQAKEAERLQEEQYQLREQIAYEYADRISKIEKDLAREIADIQRANFASPEQTRGFIQNAQNRADLEKQLYIAQLTQQYSEWRATEEQKLDYKVHVNELMIQLDSDMNDDLKKQAMQSLRDQANYELAQIQLAKETRIFQAQQALMTEQEAVSARYALEMQEIAKIADLKERQAIAEAKTAAFIRGNLRPQGDPLLPASSQTNVEKLQEETGRQLLEMQNRYMLAQQMAKSNNDELLRIDREYLAAKEQLHSEYDIQVVEARNQDYNNQMQFYGQMLSQTSAVWNGMTDMVKEAKGENSKTFKAMFLAGRAMAIAQQIINTELAAGATLAQTGIFGLPAATAIRAVGYASVGLIAAQTMMGFKSGGYTGSGGTSDVAGVVHGQEYVLNAEATKRVGRGTLDALNNGGTLESGSGVNVIINVPQGYKAVQTQSENGVTIDIVENMINQSWGNVNRPNSNESRAIQGAFGIAPKR